MEAMVTVMVGLMTDGIVSSKSCSVALSMRGSLSKCFSRSHAESYTIGIRSSVALVASMIKVIDLCMDNPLLLKGICILLWRQALFA